MQERERKRERGGDYFAARIKILRGIKREKERVSEN